MDPAGVGVRGWGRGHCIQGPGRVGSSWQSALAPQGLSWWRAQCLAGGSRPQLCPQARSQGSGSLCSPLRVPPTAPGPTLRPQWVGGWGVAGGMARDLPSPHRKLRAGGREQVDGRPGPSLSNTAPGSPQPSSCPPALPPGLVHSPHTSLPTALSSDPVDGTGTGMKPQALSLHLLLWAQLCLSRSREWPGEQGPWLGWRYPLGLPPPRQSLLSLVEAQGCQ